MKKTLLSSLLIFCAINFISAQCTTPETPYTTLNIPGIIEAENYDNGCNGVAFYDADAINYGGSYRTDAVDILPCSDLGGGYMITRIANGEWLKYTVNIDTSGSYKLDIRVASANSGSLFHIEFDSVNVSGSLSVPKTGGGQNWTSVRTSLNLKAGKHIMRIFFDKGGFNLNKISFSGQYDVSNFTVDYAVNSGFPLEKKFDLMNSGNQAITKYTRGDVDLYGQARVKSLRIDLGWGSGWSSMFTNMISGSSSSIVYNFGNIDYLSQQLKKNCMGGYWSYAYCPNFLQTTSWTNQPNDLTKWKEILKSCALHFKTNKLRPDFQAIWNEPDLPFTSTQSLGFYTGSSSDYVQLYDFGIRGLTEGDPEANIGGPDITGIPGGGGDWMSPILDHIKTNNLRLDFFSFHDIAGSTTTVNTSVDLVRDAFKARGTYFDKTEILCTELLTFGTTDPTLNTFECVPTILNMFSSMVQKPDFKRAHWAQGTSDDLIGVINTNGYRRASYFAFKFYGMMPLDQKLVSGNTLINTLASGDEHNACFMAWNTTGNLQRLNMTFKNVPFHSGILEIHRIDNIHNSYGNLSSSEGIAPKIINVADIANFIWKDSIVNNATILFKLSDGSGLSEQDVVNYPVNLIHRYYYFPERTKNNYAMYDKYAWVARLGMNNNDKAYSICGHSMDNLPPALKVKFVTDGNLQTIDSNSVLGLRIDYEVDTLFTKGVLFHGSIYNSNRNALMPWGTQKQADEDHQVNLSNFEIAFADYAPQNWTGKVILSFIMQNTGANSRAKIQLEPTGILYPFKSLIIPGIIEAVDFDKGGANVSYHDADSMNSGGLYRKDEGVDITLSQDSKGGKYQVDSTVTGEWLKYTVNVQRPTTYVIETRVASKLNGGAFHILFNDTISTNTIHVNNTCGFQNWQSIFDTIVLPQGITIMTVKIDSGGFNFNRFNVYGLEKPYAGIIEIPGTLEAENFNINGYYDPNPSATGNTYRPDQYIDIATKSSVTYLTNTTDKEWVEYSVHVAQTDTFDITTHIASPVSNSSITIFVDDSLCTTIKVPNFSSYNTFNTILQSAILDSGIHIVRLLFNKGGFYLDKLVFSIHVNGIQDLDNVSKNISVFPNPANNQLTINSNQVLIQEIYINDIQGRVVYQNKESFNRSRTVDVSDLQNGIYFIQCKTVEGIVNKKLVIQK